MASLIIVRGLPGSGKTTYAESLPERVLVEADHFRVDSETGEYSYRVAENPKVHRQCYERVKALLQAGEDVTVANVFSLRRQVRQYYELAQELGITDVTTVEMKGQHKSHHTDTEIIERMANEWQLAYGDQVEAEGIVTTIRRLTKNQILFGLRLHSTALIDELGDDDSNNCIGVSKVYVQAERKLLDMVPRVGDCWLIKGSLEYDPFTVNKMVANRCKRCLPVGRALLNSIIEDKELFANIGEMNIKRVWTKCRPNLQAVLDSGDPDGQLTDPIVGNLPIVKATKLLGGWKEHRANFAIMEWLQANGLSSDITTKVYMFWGEDAIDRVKENPYCLMSFFNWKMVDRLALALGIVEDDPRRYAAAIEAICYKAHESGSTALRGSELNFRICELLGLDAFDFEIKEEIWHDWLCYFDEDDMVQLADIYAQETFIERFISRLNETATWKVTFDVNRLVEFEMRMTEELRAAGQLGLDEYFELNDDQAAAVPFLLQHRICCLTGSAGVGKTTVLRAVIDQLPLNTTLILLTPTGSAAGVLSKLTNRKVMTIARYVLEARQKNVHQRGAIDDVWVMVDESNMVCLADAYCLMKSLPESARLIFIGDSCLLPPVNAGLIFHRIVADDSTVPCYELTEAMNAAENTGITQLSKAILAGINPGSELLRMICCEQDHAEQVQTTGCAFVMTTGSKSTMDATLMEYRRIKEQAGEAPQIIAASNLMCHSINVKLQAEHMEERQYYNKSTPVIEILAPKLPGQYQYITLGDTVLWHTSNDKARDLCNGDLGIVIGVYPERKIVISDSGKLQYVCLEVQFEDKLVALTENDLNYLALGYAISGYISQGSRWNHVVIVIEKSNWAGDGGIEIIDRCWIYTALTRAKLQVSIVGDNKLFVDTVKANPLAEHRLCGFHCRSTTPTKGGVV